jgi:uncharacterized protein (TIGR02996 family)
MTDQESDLLSKVILHPAEDAPRLAYAGWLEAHGRADRARLIRVQCQRETLQAEEAALLDRHAEEWGQELRQFGVRHWRFHRGFPEEIHTYTSDYLKHHADLATVTPVTRLHVSPANDAQLIQLAALPTARHFRALEVGLDAGGFGPDGIRAITTSSHLSGLRELGLHSNDIGPEGVRLLAEAPFVGNLTKLVVNDPNLREGGHPGFSDLVDALNPNLIRHFQWVTGIHEGDSSLFRMRRADRAKEKDSGPRK